MQVTPARCAPRGRARTCGGRGEEARGDALREVLAGEGDDRDARPEHVAARGVRVEQRRVEENVRVPLPPARPRASARGARHSGAGRHLCEQLGRGGTFVSSSVSFGNLASTCRRVGSTPAACAAFARCLCAALEKLSIHSRARGTAFNTLIHVPHTSGSTLYSCAAPRASAAPRARTRRRRVRTAQAQAARAAQGAVRARGVLTARGSRAGAKARLVEAGEDEIILCEARVGAARAAGREHLAPCGAVRVHQVREGRQRHLLPVPLFASHSASAPRQGAKGGEGGKALNAASSTPTGCRVSAEKRVRARSGAQGTHHAAASGRSVQRSATM